ncbi:MAG: alkaline phosphatase D family protein [Bacteroidota bacterium]
MQTFLLTLLSSLFLLGGMQTPSPNAFHSNWPKTTRYWVGADYWANRLQDWQLKDGKLQCIGGQYPRRTLHLLSHSLDAEQGNLSIQVEIRHLGDKLEEEDHVGFLIGAGQKGDDYRRGILSHQVMGKDAGMFVGVNGKGKFTIFPEDQPYNYVSFHLPLDNFERLIREGLSLQVDWISHKDWKHKPVDVKMQLKDSSGKVLTEYEMGVNRPAPTGSIAILANGGANQNGLSFEFADWKAEGDLLLAQNGRSLGPVVAAQHTLHRKQLKINAQMVPIGPDDPQSVRLEAQIDGQWQRLAEAEIMRPGFNAVLEVSNWAYEQDVPYRIVYRPTEYAEDQYFTGTIRQEPGINKPLVVAGFTGNNQTHGSFGKNNFPFNQTRIWFPHEDLTKSVAHHKPDMLFFSGDQLYEGRPTWADRRGGEYSELDYLYKWYLFLWSFQDLMRDIPSVCIPDDHDVYHGNVWGNGGSIPDPNAVTPDHYLDRFKGHWIQDQGGYRMGTDFVNMVDRTQTAHLPDPYHQIPIKNSIKTYYTGLTYGGVSFAVLEDRKFKSSPTMVIPDANVINGFSQIKAYPAEKLNVPQAVLLGQAQLDFLEDWTQDWQGAWMKASLSQTIFANVSTYPDTFLTDAGTPRLKPLERGIIPKDYSVAKDMDSNGWPQAGRDNALKALRKGHTFMYAGDQHLGTLVHHGVDEWEDAGYSFCVPSVANLWPRRWFPPERGENHQAGMPNYTGRYYDGFGNRITLWAASNPYISNESPKALHDRAPGYGIVRFDKQGQKITVECWPRYVDPAFSREQYPGWPRTLPYLDNYGRKAPFSLPPIKVEGLNQLPVILIYDSEGEFVIGRRMQSFQEQVAVFAEGSYQIKIGEPGVEMKTLKRVRTDREKTITIKFR